MQTSALFTIDFTDFAKGLKVAIGGAVIAAAEASIQAGVLTFNWKTAGSAALAAGLSYLGKNFFTPAKTISPVEAAKGGS
jgi:hypothetical protein